MYSHDPAYLDYKPAKEVRLWPWVIAGLVVALCLWAYWEPNPTMPPMERPFIGPDSPLYGPLKGH